MELELSEMEVDDVGYNRGREFIKQNHYTKTVGSACILHGLFLSEYDELVGCIAYHSPISENVRKSVFGEDMKDFVIELQRLVTLDECPKNTESYFISRSLNKLKAETNYNAVISFADSTEGHVGKVYQASNFIYTGMTEKKKFYRKPNGELKAPRISSENISEKEAIERGWKVEKRESKYKYIFLLENNGLTKTELKK